MIRFIYISFIVCFLSVFFGTIGYSNSIDDSSGISKSIFDTTCERQLHLLVEKQQKIEKSRIEVLMEKRKTETSLYLIMLFVALASFLVFRLKKSRLIWMNYFLFFLMHFSLFQLLSRLFSVYIDDYSITGWPADLAADVFLMIIISIFAALWLKFFSLKK